MKKSYICGQFIDLVESNIQGRIEAGQRGQLPRALRSKGALRDDIYLF